MFAYVKVACTWQTTFEQEVHQVGGSNGEMAEGREEVVVVWQTRDLMAEHQHVKMERRRQHLRRERARNWEDKRS